MLRLYRMDHLLKADDCCPCRRVTAVIRFVCVPALKSYSVPVAVVGRTVVMTAIALVVVAVVVTGSVRAIGQCTGCERGCCLIG